MIKFKTIPEIELFDNYKNSIGNFVIRMIINDVLFDKKHFEVFEPKEGILKYL